MSHWIYQGKELKSIEDVPNPKSIGFIYLMVQKSTGLKYIGRKLLRSPAYKTVNGKRKKSMVESNWKDYYSSSPEIKELIKEIGTEDFTREILCFVNTKGAMVYAEEFALYMSGALESNDWFNRNIRAKVYENWISKDLENIKQLRLTIQNME